MEEWDVRLLEHTAIRNETSMDFRVWNELERAGFINHFEFPVISDLRRIREDVNAQMLTDRTLALISDAVGSSDKVRRVTDRYFKLAEENNISVIGRGDTRYPCIWDHLSGMPPVIFVKGDLSTLYELDINGGASMVGSRKPGRYALYATGEFSAKLSQKNVVIVSGLAMGIDAKAHDACINSGGKTVAVVPGGCDVIYPYQNKDLYDRICENGVILSELPPGQEIIKQYFPSRNRLISALSDVCLIMEAGRYSGTLHTASFAAAQSREVFVLPNSIYDENSVGGLLLLRDGAEVLIDVDTVYERIREASEYRGDEVKEQYSIICTPGEKCDISRLRYKAKDSPESLTESEWKDLVCDEVSEKPKNIDELCISLGIPFSFLSALVTGLETEGRIANDRGKYVLTIHGR